MLLNILNAINHAVMFQDAAQVHAADTIYLTGPGVWSDEVHWHLLREYGVRYGVPPLTGKSEIKRRATVIGSALILPMHSFADNSGGVRMTEAAYVNVCLLLWILW